MAHARHKRETNARRRPTAAVVAAPVAFVATAAVVTAGVLAGDPVASSDHQLTAQTSGQSSANRAAAALGSVADREASVSRSLPRGAKSAGPTVPKDKAALMLAPAAVRAAVAAARSAKTKLWTTSELNLWSSPREKAEQVGVLAAGEHVLVTGRKVLDREEVVVEGKARWVTAGYLSEEEPPALGGECTNGTSVPDGVSENVKKVHAAVCANFPDISTYGTFRSDGEHSQGLAVDIMVSGAEGWDIAEFLRDNYADLGVSYLIYEQQIWSVERGGEGWRGMSDRGSATANHFDHVHVTTY
ncbi:MAG TPA: hypothetical protein VGE38_03915 [Nocardioides sp.]|uniref:hypothetical protein n=1 Tax=Nocardioides sp. TaxID=35761 RepID=UPI002ED7C3B9